MLYIIFIVLMSCFSVAQSMIAEEQQLINAIKAQDIPTIIYLTKKKIVIYQSEMYELVTHSESKQSIICELIIGYYLANDIDQTYEMGFALMMPASHLKKFNHCMRNAGKVCDKLQIFDVTLRLQYLERALLTLGSSKQQGEEELRDSVHKILECKIQNNNKEDSTNNNQPKIIQNDIYVSMPSPESSFFQKYRYLLIPAGFVFTSYLYQLYRLKKIERMLDDQNSWMNWLDYSDEDLLSMPKDEFLKKLKFSIFMKYKSIEEIADPYKALEHFDIDITYEIEQLKYYVSKCKSLAAWGLSTVFGIYRSTVKDAKEKLKQAKYLKDTFMRWDADRRLKKPASRVI